MAAGDVFSGNASVAAGAYLTIQPTTEATIHNIYWDITGTPNISIEQFDGTNSTIFAQNLTDPERGMVYHATNTLYLRVKNNGTGAIRIGYDGVLTK